MPIDQLRQLRLFSALLTLGLCLILLLASDQRFARSSASASLQGASAIEHLKAQGLYGSLGEALEAAQYRIGEMRDGSYKGANQAQSLEVKFDQTGLRLKPREGAKWESGMRLRGYGYGERIAAVGAGEMKASGNRIEIHHATGEQSAITAGGQSAISEWYVNRPSGLEQGFTIFAPPGERNDGARLRLALEVTGDLEPRLSADGETIKLRERNGEEALGYSKLAAFDARGRELPARMGVEGREVRLEVEDEGAQYPLTIDPVFTQQAYLKASNTGKDDWFGFSVAISGDTVVVGAPFEDSSATGAGGDQSDESAFDSGAAYVFVRSGAMWSQQAYLKASNTGKFDLFGFSVAISGDTIVVGATNEDSSATTINGDQNDNSALDAGAAYVFVRSGGVWSQQAYLKASNAELLDSFGAAVAISGDTIVVTSSEDSKATGINGDQSDNSSSISGAAYVFVRNGGSWSQQAYLKASNTGMNDFFGGSVAISGDTVVVGAVGEDSNATGVGGNQGNNTAKDSGAAYVFVRSGGVWSQQAYLKASNTDAFDLFGYSVAISGDTIVVGARAEASNATGINGDQSDDSALFTGAAYVFVRSGGVWSQQAYLKASNTGVNDSFGNSVAISGDRIVVGAWFEDSNATGINGNQGDDSVKDSGAAYVFARSGGVWSQQAYLKASNTDANDEFGHSVGISGDTVVVGAKMEDSNATGTGGDGNDNSVTDAGAAYIFTIESSTTCPVITFPDLPAGAAGIAYSQSIAASPAGSYTYSLILGMLPPGFSLNPTTGLISGMTKITGSYNFTIRAQAPGGCSATMPYSLAIACPQIALNPMSLPGGAAGTPYSATLSAAPATGTYTFTIAAGSLPNGLMLNSTTGKISGVPSQNGLFNFTVKATGYGSCSMTKAYTITIGSAACPTITLGDLSGGSVGKLYNKLVTASPSGSYSYAVTGGSLPPGVTLYGAIGLLYGYPTVPGTYNFTITATGSGGCNGSRSYMLTIGAK